MSLLKIRPFSIDLTDTFTFANANVTGNIISGNANLGNLTTSNYFIGNGSLLSSINGSNISGQVGNALVAGTVYGAAQGNITSLGTLTGLTSGGTVNFTSSSNVALGPVGNIHITGGTAGYVLSTDGSGGLSWVSVASGTGNANIAGSNTQIFFNDNGSSTLGAKSTFTFDKVTDTLTVTNLTANGAGITYITGANVSGNVTSAVQSNFANIANSVAGANVSGTVAQATFAGTANSVAGANVSGTVAQATFAGTANSVAGANVSGTVAQATFAGTANSVAGANVSGTVAQATFAGTANSVAGANVSGNVSSAVQSHYANIANSVAGANVSGEVTYAATANAVAGANVSGQVANANVAYFESVTTQTTGTFYPVFVSGNANGNYALASNTALSFDAATGVLTTGTIQSGGGSGGNITGANLISANFFSGSGNLLSNIQGANVSGNVSSAVQSHYANIANSVAGANVSGNVSSAVQSNFANIANSVAGANVSGNVSSAVQSNFANIANSVTWSNVTSTPTTISGYGITDAYANSNVASYLPTYTGELAGANLVLTGNLVISGTTTSVNSTITRVVDPIFELGGGANGAALITDDNKDRGIVLHYYTGSSAVDAFIGWDDSNVEFGVGSNVSLTGEVVTWNNYGNLRAGYFLGNGSQLTGVLASSSLNMVNGTSNVDIATTNGNVTVGVGGTAGVVTITTTGVNVSGTLNSTGNLTAGNANLGNLATANFFTGNGSQLSALAFGNIATFSTAGLTTDELYLQAITRLNVTASGVSGYLFDQYGATLNPAIYVTSGQTLAFNLGVAGHPFLIQTSGGANYSTGLEHVDTTGTVLTASSAQGQIAGTLYWKVPYGITGTYKYQCSAHGGMNGNIVVTDSNVANITVGTATFAGTANSVAGANVSGTVAQATFAGTANSVAGANVSGTVAQATFAGTANSVAGANVSGTVAQATFAGTANSVAGANVSGQVGNALVAGTVYTAAQGNITSVGTLTGLVSGGIVDFTTSSNVTLGAVANLHISGGTANYYLRTDGSGTLSWASVPTTTLNVDTYTGDGSFTMKTLTATPANINFTLVAIGGVFQPRDAYSISGAVITFDDPPPNGAIVEVTTIVAGAAGAGGGGASVLDDLTDVTITSPSNNQVLKYNGASWVNGAGAASWTYSAVSANTSAVAGYRYIVDTATANLTITLPASGTLGDEVMIIDGTGNSSSHAITVDRNGGKIQGAASNMTVTTDRAAFTLVYYNSTQGWLLTNV